MLYIHVPFCHKACSYCDFYFVTSLKYKAEYVQAMQNEIILRKNEIPQQLPTVYFGGGTPSKLTLPEIEKILSTVHSLFKVSSDTEITLEANPEDLNYDYIKGLISVGVNRLSIGIQSFDDAELQFMNRSHDAQKAEYSVKLSQDTGIENISIDLIYGSPLLTHSKWEQHIRKTISLSVPHISAYNLTIEPNTPLFQKIKKGMITGVDEEKSADYFKMLMENLVGAGFEHYEISNFALPNKYSKHNTGYWKHLPYLGVGPAAHSFDTHTRSWNTRNLNTYLTRLLKHELCIEESEQLSLEQQANEYLMLGLRTQWGANLNVIKDKTGIDFFLIKSMEIEQFEERNLLISQKNNLSLTYQGKLLADYITEKLIV